MWDPIVSVPDHCLSFYFNNIASVTKPSLKFSYTERTFKTCSSSSTHEAQWKQTCSLRSKFWYRRVSTLMPDLKLIKHPLGYVFEIFFLNTTVQLESHFSFVYMYEVCFHYYLF